MALSWNEIRTRALEFQKEWTGTKKERAETQSFYNDFFDVFGISRRRMASFEEPVKKLGDKQGFIDLFWKGVLLVEQKSAGRDLKRAKEQALEYFPNLKENELPQYILVSDFNQFELYDLEEDKEYKFELKDFHKNVEIFGFMAGYKKKEYKDFEPANIKASELMGALFDQLRTSGYKEHDLELFLVRILFCLFADDTGIFEKDIFKQFIEERTKEDGSDTGAKLIELFQTLDTPVEKRQKTLDESIDAFPYINGSLFDKAVKIPAFDSKMRRALLDCCYFEWAKVSPAIFGSLFQCVADKEKRRTLGEHYTTEKNIMKTISPLFLDELKEEFEKLKNDKSNQKGKRLQDFQKKISNLKFLDPACGCGNFLVISYREIRRLEIDILKERYKSTQLSLDMSNMSWIDVDNFYGIEIDEFPAKIAEVAMWLCDHQMNVELSETFGQYFSRIPLKKSANITHENALKIDWKEIVSPNELSYIFGNPPFIGARMKSSEQSAEMEAICKGLKNQGILDYVCAWYLKSAEYIQNTKIQCAFVSTNSIVQGEHIGVLWKELLKNDIKINFAHRTFMWDSEASGKAKVHCVIIGFANYDKENKKLFEYKNIKGEPHQVIAKNINPYLIDFKNIIIEQRTLPISKIPPMRFGSMPRDGGHLIMTKEEKDKVLDLEPNLKRWIRPYTGAQEFINGYTRYCFWLLDISPKEISESNYLMLILDNVRKFRLSSKASSTRNFADTPSIFCQLAQPDSDYLLIPRVSSERRKYIPIGYIDKNTIANDQVLTVSNASLYEFGILTSIMHMTWNKYICGRLKSDYRYSKDIVYNNYPWPVNPSNKQKEAVKQKAQDVLDIRAKYPDCTLAILYNPETMPADLIKSHNELDKAVDACYGKKSFTTEMERMEFLFNLYEQYTTLLTKKTTIK